MIFEEISVEPLIHKNRAIPDYHISKCGKILSFKQTKATGIPKWHKVNKKQQIDHKERGSNPKYVRPKCTNLSIPIGFFPEYDFTRCTSSTGVKSKNHSKVPVNAVSFEFFVFLFESSNLVCDWSTILVSIIKLNILLYIIPSCI